MDTVLVALARELNADLSNDALIYAGSATWEQWQAHVPTGVILEWHKLSREARAAVFLTAHSVTMYNERPESDLNPQIIADAVAKAKRETKA